MQDQENIFDAAIIGGGIAGAAIARDAALRGLRVVLFEKNTFGSGTSSKSSKLIHGGIRYLDLAWQALLRGRIGEFWKNFHFVFRSLGECRILAKIAPGLVRPIPLLIPVYRSAGRSVAAVISGTFLYSFLGLLTGKFYAPRVFWTAEKLLKLLPDLNPEGLAGGVMIWDHTTDDLQLVEETMRSAVRRGARAYEKSEVQDYRWDPAGGFFDLYVAMVEGRKRFRARKLIDAAGPWVDAVRDKGREKDSEFIVPVAGCHIHLPKFTGHSVILEARDQRVFFVINIGEEARVGTTERLHADPDRVEATEAEIEYLLAELRRYFPRREFARKAVLRHDAGIRPLARPADAQSPHMISREHEVRFGPSGAIHVLGVKLTDHRRAAEEVVDLLSAVKSMTARTPLR